MAKEKVTITLDRSKVAAVRALVEVRTTSEAIDLALDRLIGAERLRRDVVAYSLLPLTEAEIDPSVWGKAFELDDGTDWEGLYSEDEE